MLEVLTETPLFYAGVFAFGLIIGSFLNVVIYRLPVMLERDWRCQCEELLDIENRSEPERFNLAWPPSRCPSCESEIGPLQNVPVISYLLLRGRCKNCGTGISPRYPLVELFTAIAFLLVAHHFGPTTQMLTGLLLTAVLITLSMIDFDTQLLPDNLTVPLLWSGLLINLWSVHATPTDAIIGAIAGYLMLWTVYQGFKLLTGKEGMGYGDFKLLAALGAWMGWQALPMVILFSSLVGALAGIALLLTGKQEKAQPMPFGPFLAGAGFITLLWGEAVLDGYLSFLGMN